MSTCAIITSILINQGEANMADISKYLELVKQGIIAKLGQRCDNRDGYYCMIVQNGNIVPSIVVIENNGVTIEPISGAQEQPQKE